MKPKAIFAHYITMVSLTDRMQSFSLRCLSPHSLTKQRKCQHTVTQTVFLEEMTKFSKTMKPKANFAHYITMIPLTDSMQSFSPRCLSPHSLMKQRKCQITIIDLVLLARNCDYSAKQWNTKTVLHIFKLTVTIFSLETNEGGHSKIKSYH